MIPLSVPNLAGNEWKYIKDCLDTNWVSSVGSYVDRFEQSLAEYTGAGYAVSTSNGTAALHISLMLAGVQAGDHVILPNITFIASANSVKYVNADPVFVDIDKETWQMDLALLEKYMEQHAVVAEGKCTHKHTGKPIRAIMPVHVLGNMCDMDRLLAIAEMYHMAVIEDSTESLGSRYKGKHSGTFGTFGCFSFNGNKIITTGGGGMIVTNDEQLARRAKHLTTQAKSDAFEYVHDEVGYNYRLVNLLAAMGLAQMELLPSFLQRKQEIADMYTSGLSGIADIHHQKVSADVLPNHWLFTVRCSGQKKLIEHLTKNKIQVRPLWVPMNQLKMFRDAIFVSEHNESDKVYQSALSLPCSTGITNAEVEEVMGRIKEIYK
jgi:perosamine synthetase